MSCIDAILNEAFDTALARSAPTAKTRSRAADHCEVRRLAAEGLCKSRIAARIGRSVGFVDGFLRANPDVTVANGNERMTESKVKHMMKLRRGNALRFKRRSELGLSRSQYQAYRLFRHHKFTEAEALDMLGVSNG